jgi:oxygen-independent coproporphyrinogen III oxidase
MRARMVARRVGLGAFPVLTLAEMLAGTPYVAYPCSYPHQTAYRPLDPPVPLDALWAQEPRDALLLHLHVPFCELRPGSRDPFTTPRPAADDVEAYLAALMRQARRVRAALPGDARWARVTLGGGTPTCLSPAQLATLLDIAEEVMGADLGAIPISVETSPETATPERIRLLVQRGVDRISIGVQSFFEIECRAVNRPQKPARVEAALDVIRSSGCATLNLDLRYGLPGQTRATWLASLHRALRFRPEELSLYPLYLRPLTALERSGRRSWDDERLDRYRAGRELLLAEGYHQVSMRRFRAGHAPDAGVGPVHRCPEDGTVGLGCGARSCAESLHHSTAYAVGARGVRQILADYLARDEARFAVADHGFRLDADERRRRHVILSLLSEGLDRAAYRRRFGSDALADLPQLRELVAAGLATASPERLALTAAGAERADTIGPWLHSERVVARMTSFEPR